MTHVIQASRSHRRRSASGIWYVESNGSDTDLNCGSDASLDDVPLADFTIEGWSRRDGNGVVYAQLFDSWNLAGTGPAGGTGLFIAYQNQAYTLYLYLCHATTDAAIYTSTPTPQGAWFHWAFVWDVATKRPTYYLQGSNASDSIQAGVGAYPSDAANNHKILHSGNCLPGAAGWLRISDNKRYTAAFAPPSRTSPPAVDANTIEQWNMDDGGGTTIAAQVNSNNNGTLSNGVWRYG